MTSNFTFAFNRMIPPSAWANAPVSRAPVSNAPVSRTAAIANVPMTRSNRFSMTRMINFKSSGGCRACN